MLISLSAAPGRAQPPGINVTGYHGLNAVPTARMDTPGTIRLGASTLDPYMHSFIGAQLSNSLYLSLRQTGEISSLTGGARRLYPGLDMRLRLMEEGRYRPALTLGLQSAIGHKRMAGEYLAASKRFGAFDFHAGLAWGRLGSAGHIDNPLGILGSHFDKARPLGGPDSNAPDDWFTGRRAGLFAGLSYRTPLDGLRLNLEWGADEYVREQAAITGFDAPEPWAVGLDYHPAKWAGLGLAVIGGEKIMARLNLQTDAGQWRGKAAAEDDPPPLNRARLSRPRPLQATRRARADKLDTGTITIDEKQAQTALHIRDTAPAPRQIGRLARHMANHAGPDAEGLGIATRYYGLKGPALTLSRRDLEQALRTDQGSPEEIWANLDINHAVRPPAEAGERSATGEQLSFTLDTDLSFTAEEASMFYRTGLITGYRLPLTRHLLSDQALRLNIADNLSGLRRLRPGGAETARGNAEFFAARGLALERASLAWLDTYGGQAHIRLEAGYLEEMYAGYGGEILWRPPDRAWALGLRAHHAWRRDPFSTLNLGLVEGGVATGHLAAYYAVPGTDYTLKATAGRYLAGDWGGTLAIDKQLDNGIGIEGFVTATDMAEADIFGGESQIHGGLRLSVPLGRISCMPGGSTARFDIEPVGRDGGQKLETALPLYPATEKFTRRRLSRSWSHVLN